MPGTNDFLTFATDMAAEVLTQLQWQNDADRPVGWSVGPADNYAINKAIRQACFVAAAVAQMIANTGPNVLDDGDITSFVTLLQSVISSGGGTLVNITNDYNVTGSESIILCNAAAGPIEVTYNPITTTNKILIGKIDSSANAITFFDGISIRGAINSAPVGGQIAAYTAFSDRTNLWLV